MWRTSGRGRCQFSVENPKDKAAAAEGGAEAAEHPVALDEEHLQAAVGEQVGHGEAAHSAADDNRIDALGVVASEYAMTHYLLWPPSSCRQSTRRDFASSDHRQLEISGR
jgi:hypothetical protein